MILILHEKGDISALKTAEWIKYLAPEKKLLLINEDTPIEYLEIDINNEDCHIKFKNFSKIALNEIQAFWYRRGDFHISLEENAGNIELEYLANEWKSLKEYIYNSLEKKTTCYCSFFKSDLNKLIVLEAAKKVGLNIPASFCVSQKNNLYKISKKFPLITKSFNFVLNLKYDDRLDYTLTSVVSRQEIEKMSKTFFPSFIQEKIQKSYEIRVFIFSNRIWSMAILSQENDKTLIDYRNYDDSNPNRCIPYKLPNHIEKKLFKLFSLLQLNSGSVDLILDENYEYQFLEINPDGQFDWVSENCNYYIEMEIAKILINHE